MRFLSAKDKGKIAIFGVPYDSTTCFRPGARFGSDGIRFFSKNLETYSPGLDMDLNDVSFCDLGNVDVPVIPELMVKTVEGFVDRIDFPIALGGEHSITYPIVKSLAKRYKDLTVIQFDAHADLRESYNGTKFSHACVMRRILDLGCKLIQVGIRSGLREEFDLMETSKSIRLVDLTNLTSTLEGTNQPIYVTVDIDFFDPAFAPGTGTPEPCGFSPSAFFDIIYKLPFINVIGFDVVEVSPPFDPSGITQVLGA
ncbi:MAG: agmatinase, partial [Nitrospiraceae bacterium]|nr:agmatinase [Nitrospiraceae bacterium]